MLIDITKFKEIAEATQAIATTIGIIIGGAWVLRNYVFQREYFPRIDFSVDVNFIGVHKGEWLIEVLGLLNNRGQVPHTIQSFRFELRCLSKGDALIDGDAAIRGQVVFPHVIKENSWIPAIEGVGMIIHPGVSLRYNYVYRIPEDTVFVLLHGILDYGKKSLQHRADRMLKVPDKVEASNLRVV